MSPSSALLAVLDERAQIVAFNDALLSFVGQSAEELRNADFADLLVHEDRRRAFRNFFQSRTDSGARIDAWLTCADGRRPVQLWLSRLDTSTESRARFAVTAVDQGSDHEAWNRLAEKEARLQSILDTAVDGIVTIDDKGIIESLNLATESIFGYSSEELIGQNVKTLMPPPYRNEHDGYLSNYLCTGKKKIIGIGREVEGRRKDGATFPLDLAVSEFYVAGQRRFMGLMRDISERKQAEREARRHLDELAHASRLSALGEMTTGIAHEVNQPLAAIVSYAQACLNLLDSENTDKALVKDALTQIAAQARRAGEIVHHLRQLVRKDATERASIDVNGCVRAVMNLFAAELESSGVTISLDLDDDLPRVRADRVQIEQVLLNLIRNALDVLSEQASSSKRISIGSRSTGEKGVEIFVTDTGPGLGGKDPDRLFETFYTTKPSGLGVGLSISRSIIESHGGRLWAKENRGGGLSVHFVLPAKERNE
ncbi:MAG: PAS domain S-box protein [Gammaproteobacteria bacterium]|nr:PAS domain S-box protein [Gammaproteobacteria bacterium]